MFGNYKFVVKRGRYAYTPPPPLRGMDDDDLITIIKPNENEACWNCSKSNVKLWFHIDQEGPECFPCYVKTGEFVEKLNRIENRMRNLEYRRGA